MSQLFTLVLMLMLVLLLHRKPAFRSTLFYLSYPTLPYPTPPHPTLPYPTLPHPTLPYPTLPYPTILCIFKRDIKNNIHDTTLKLSLRRNKTLAVLLGIMLTQKKNPSRNCALKAAVILFNKKI